MASTALERVREAHEDIEALVTLSASALGARDGGATAPLAPRTPRTPLEASQLARALIDQATERSKAVAEQYTDNAGALADAVRATRLSGTTHTSAYLRPFYDKLRDVRAAHRDANSKLHAQQTQDAEDVTTERDAELMASLPEIEPWNPEEANGSCLDLQPYHVKFVELAAKSIDYVAYVRATIIETQAIKPKTRRSNPYLEYLNELMKYLFNFASRAYPLDDVDKLIKLEEKRLQSEQQAAREVLVARFRNDPDACLNALGVDGVGARLNALALKTGGRPVERAKRLLDHARGNEPSNLVVIEGIVRYLCVDVLGEERVATAHNAEKKLALSYQELEAERAAQAAGNTHPQPTEQESNPEPTDNAVYNPKDVPLGWDGKPMPYWLYKLHGLNHDYTCEICGGAVYRGPRAFERHFSGAQHVAGLRCLGIRYSKAFLMVTSISDAVALHNRLQQASNEAAPDAVECEDANGNVSVLGRKTVDDMARQGLL